MNKQNDCTKYREDIAALTLGLLEPEEAEKLQKHLETCQSCKSLYEAMLNEEDNLRSGFQEIAQKGEVLQNSMIEKLKENKQENISHEKNIKINKYRFTNHPLIKFVAAAVIVIAALLIFNNSSSPAFGLDDVIEAMNNAQWMYSWYENTNAGTSTRSHGLWHGVNPYRTVNIGTGNISYSESTLGKSYYYNSKSNTITISYNGSKSKRDYENISDLVFSELSDYKKRGVKVTYSNGRIDGRSVMIINYDSSESTFYRTDMNTTMYVDLKTRLPIKVQHNDKNGKPRNPDTYLVYDFPDKGPEDIYEAGAPRDAKVIITHSKDNPYIFETPDVPELVKKLTRYNVARDHLLTDYTLITTYEYDSTIRMLDVVYHQGRFESENQRSICYSAKDLAEIMNENRNFISNFKSLLEWSKTKNNEYQDTEIKYHGGFYFSADLGLKDLWITEGRRNWPVNINNLPEWGWPEILPKKNVKQIENEYSRENGFIAFERITEPEICNDKLMNAAEKDIYYLDPNHDYMCVRKEEYKHFIMGGTPINDINIDVNDISNGITYVQNVTEFGRTETGQWYPEKIEVFSKTWNDNGKAQPLSLSFIATLYLNTNPEFPGRLFNPENPPMPEEKQNVSFSGSLSNEYFNRENK